MKITILAIVCAYAASVFAQFNGVPTCAQPCVLTYLSGTTIAGCNSIDVACICSNTDFLGGIACCLAANCSPADQASAVAFAQNLCKTNGVTNLPSAVSCASTASTVRPSTASSGTTSPTTTAAILASTTSNSAATTSMASSSTMGSATSSASSASASVSKAAGAQNVMAMGAGFAGGLAAMVALL